MGKSFKNAVLLRLVFLLQWIIFLTCSKQYRGEKLDNKPYVILFWHGRIALMPFAFKHYRMPQKKAYVIISRHRDGENIAKIISFYGLHSIRGSSSKGASQVLKAALKILDQKDDIIITPDGPRGPYHSISDGPILLAQKKNVTIRILNYEANHFWKFKSWDKMILPKPFSKLVYSLSEPFDISNLKKDEAKKFLLDQFENIAKTDSFKE
ncbi:lysophospholipid acyltransferase family protein [Campylobacter sp. MIT 21-1685]|uniref:lysophospholipid acyltransferase family protein n=1 Tax=unclassified Campylobacter TaxID=2593542 RepID=UPI00224B9B46|nr:MULTISPECIES: lysophospholipid acyltransferase family protein [unclassified Campylobacter]MCX2682863.1 lysophospholipid acyltransferase family protein [Campylobacter sp. MIT 21-1684]MCX2751189.1 lysophospholipid acyltransferase family protein [Campylobacter sp. MIT 21-1682]MCX2807344.1 lysophospholipid acyltransferase family protein [Campylobacter sp. MIT 21-1685]